MIQATSTWNYDSFAMTRVTFEVKCCRRSETMLMSKLEQGDDFNGLQRQALGTTLFLWLEH